VPADEQFRGFASEADNLFIATSSRIIRFLVEHTMTCAGEHGFNVPILQFGRFRRYLYAQFTNEVAFLAADTLSSHGCELCRALALDNMPPIAGLACTSQVFAVIAHPRTIFAYRFEEFSGRFIPLPCHQSPDDVITAAVLENGIVYGTAQGSVHFIEIVAQGSTSEFQRVDSFALGDKPTAMLGIGNDVVIGTESGMIAEVKQVAATKRFAEFYEVLARKVLSVGRFSKALERLPRTGKFFTSRAHVFDTAVIREFMGMKRDEQIAALKDSDFALEEAIELIGGFAR
jgi:hypothetical protein